MDSLESRLRRALKPLGFDVEKSGDRFMLKSAHGNFVVKGADALSLEQLELRANDIVRGEPVKFIPLPHSATAQALAALKSKS